jgi:hypothetical protein
MPDKDHYTLRQMIRGLNVKWGNHEFLLSSLTAQLAVDMLDKKAVNGATMLRLERCEKIAVARSQRICDLLQTLPGEAPTTYRRYVEKIDARVARLRSQKAIVAIEGALDAFKP